MSQEEIRATFDYKDGHLYWKATKSRKKLNGKRAGWTKPDTGYICVSVNRITTREHRLIWTLFNGLIPKDMFIDHLDRNRTNNRIENLRLVTQSENLRNAKTFRTNTTGVKGVYYDKGMKKYCARIYTAPYKCLVLGYSADLEEAKAMRLEAERKYGYM